MNIVLRDAAGYGVCLYGS